MIDHGELSQPDTEQPTAAATPEPSEPVRRSHSLKYGQVPRPEGSSGRRARLRHPARGAARR